MHTVSPTTTPISSIPVALARLAPDCPAIELGTTTNHLSPTEIDDFVCCDSAPSANHRSPLHTPSDAITTPAASHVITFVITNTLYMGQCVRCQNLPVRYPDNDTPLVYRTATTRVTSSAGPTAGQVGARITESRQEHPIRATSPGRPVQRRGPAIVNVPNDSVLILVIAVFTAAAFVAFRSIHAQPLFRPIPDGAPTGIPSDADRRRCAAFVPLLGALMRDPNQWTFTLTVRITDTCARISLLTMCAADAFPASMSRSNVRSHIEALCRVGNEVAQSSYRPYEDSGLIGWDRMFDAVSYASVENLLVDEFGMFRAVSIERDGYEWVFHGTAAAVARQQQPAPADIQGLMARRFVLQLPGPDVEHNADTTHEGAPTWLFDEPGALYTARTVSGPPALVLGDSL